MHGSILLHSAKTMKNNNTCPHIVILGAGFGGVYTARRLASLAKIGKIEVTIINQTNYFLFTPLLHEVATGGLSPLSAAEPLREVFRNSGVELVQASVEMVNLEKKTVQTSTCIIEYDYLVIATGAKTNFYDMPSAEEHGLTLKDLSDAARIRNRIIDVFERAARLSDSDERRRLLSFAVVGGGATGVEVSGELADFIFGTMSAYYGKSGLSPRTEASVTLIHRGRELLEQFHPKLRKLAKIVLEKHGIRVLLEKTVSIVEDQSIELADGMKIDSSTTI